MSFRDGYCRDGTSNSFCLRHGSSWTLALWDVRPELGKIQCPTLVVAGKEDWSTPPEGHKFIAQAIPNSRFAIIENASHTVPEEQADEFNRLTLEFLTQHHSSKIAF